MRSESTYTVAIFVRALGLVYAVAIGSLWLQIDGLIGSGGILPAGEYLARVANRFGDAATWVAPTLLWIAPGDAMLHGLCALGMVLAGLLMAGFIPVGALAGAWAVYLSLTVAGQTFLGFQWDNLLLEVGFLAIILVAPGWRLGRGDVLPVSRFGVFLGRWLVFRLMLGSGLVKLASGDPAWWPDLTALTYHYETTCLPVWIGWYVHRAPLWVHKVSCLLVLVSELIVPFFVFGPPRLRRVAFWVFLLQQLGIAATGNYGFFNLLTVAACLLLLDDDVWPGARRRCEVATRTARVWFGVVAMPVGAALLVVTTVILVGQVDRALGRFGSGFDVGWPAPVERLVAAVRPFRSANAYGLFARMTKHRPEIVVEGTADGRTWKPYAFRWKPGALDRRPRFVAPHQPRLDWQMWFAALGTERSTPWFTPFLHRLLTGAPAVLDLLASNPFPDTPPRAVRAVRYTYRYGDEGDAWWRREWSGPYAGPIGLTPSLDRRPGRR